MKQLELGFHASHEQFAPSKLLNAAKLAFNAGFTHGMCSDHLSPFSETQGESGFAWSWLGAALQATQLSFGTVTAPGQRYHPAIIAQALATLSEMYPARVWVALGSGENINEHVTGAAWPAKRIRQARLLECVEILRALFAGETVSHDGLVKVHEAKLYTRPSTTPRLIAAAVSAETAAWVASWADGLITVNQKPDQLRRVIAAFREHGGDGKPMYLQAHVAYAETQEQAEANALANWRVGAIPADTLWDSAFPAQIDEACKTATVEDIRSSVRMSSSIEQHRDWLLADHELGFERVYVHEVGPNQARTIEAFAELKF